MSFGKPQTGHRNIGLQFSC